MTQKYYLHAPAAVSHIVAADILCQMPVVPTDRVRGHLAMALAHMCDHKSDKCHKCDSPLDTAGYCTDLTCPFSDWLQHVSEVDLYHLTTAAIEMKYGIFKRTHTSDS